jgi:hypothetical protein
MMKLEEQAADAAKQSGAKLPYQAPALVSSDAFERLALACNGFLSPTNPPICNPNTGPKDCGGACPSS